MKMNSLVDQRCIEALYRASQAGVPIDINVRGICCLTPGVPGVSETINVISIVGRFLEHSRIYAFEFGDEQAMYIGSADLMPRNLDTRVELLVPIEKPELQAELNDTLDRCFADDTNAWTLSADGVWHRRTGAHALSSPRADGADAGQRGRRTDSRLARTPARQPSGGRPRRTRGPTNQSASAGGRGRGRAIAERDLDRLDLAVGLARPSA